MGDMDWSSWSKTRPFTIDALAVLNSNDVDPFTALVGCAICQRFKFSSHGIQNVARALGGLTELPSYKDIGLGYTERHVVPLLLKSDDGTTFLAICGALCEYYPIDTVVTFFVLLARKCELPRTMAPATSQWTRLISACAGVFATCPFPTVITKYAEHCEASISTSPAQILEWMLALNDRATGTFSVDVPFIAAVAEWMFDIKVAIRTDRGETGASEAQLILKATSSDLPTAGRVHWNAVFRTCFGQAWKDLNKDTLVAVIACASGLTHNALLSLGRDPRTFFLQHEVDIPNMAGFGVNETIISWFEELRRLAPGIQRYYKAHSGPEELKKDWDRQMQSLESDCKCSDCGDGSSAICKVSLVEVIIALGLFVARMVVVPNLFLKVNGIQEFYKQLHQNRLNRQKLHVGYSEWFIKGLTEDLPTPFKMQEVACVLFTGIPPGPMPKNQISISIYGLFIIITYLKFNPDETAEKRPAASVQVLNGGFSYFSRCMQKNFFDPGPMNIAMEDALENVRTKPKEIVQIVKLQDQHTLVSQVRRNEGWEAKAEADGWDVFT